ncbi:hypothetical protein DAI22_05g141300 [Oryza sativa Japonica Group]|nr:hypothetical protein DAI22_05g141300 [Oryza sativa Japonica Group]
MASHASFFTPCVYPSCETTPQSPPTPVCSHRRLPAPGRRGDRPPRLAVGLGPGGRLAALPPSTASGRRRELAGSCRRARAERRQAAAPPRVGRGQGGRLAASPPSTASGRRRELAGSRRRARAERRQTAAPPRVGRGVARARGRPRRRPGLQERRARHGHPLPLQRDAPGCSHILPWSGNVTRSVSKPHGRNLFLQSLVEEGQNPSTSNGASNSQKNVEDKDLLDCLENGVNFWMDGGSQPP